MIDAIIVIACLVIMHVFHEMQRERDAKRHRADNSRMADYCDKEIAEWKARYEEEHNMLLLSFAGLLPAKLAGPIAAQNSPSNEEEKPATAPEEDEKPGKRIGAPIPYLPYTPSTRKRFRAQNDREESERLRAAEEARELGKQDAAAEITAEQMADLTDRYKAQALTNAHQ